MNTRTILLCLLAAAFAGQPARAQDAPKKQLSKEMNVDLPDETEETSLVDPGVWQLETALLHTRYEQGAASTIGQLMVRYGVSERVELRALLEDGRQRDRYLDETVQGTFPLALSTKVVLIKDKKGLPDITLVGYLKLPFSGRSHEQNAYWSPILLAAFQHSWGQERWKLEYNLGAQQEAFSAEWVWLGNASLHYKIADPLELFVEYYAQFAGGADPEHNLGGGIAWQLGKHLEIYAAGGRTVNYEPYNYFGTTGIAARF